MHIESPSMPRVDVKSPKLEGGVKVDPHAAGPKVEGKGGFGLHMPKFGKDSSSSSSEDDGTGRRVKKTKGAKVGANVPAPKSPHMKGGARGEIKGDAKAKIEAKGPKVDAHAHGKGDAGGGFGIKVPKFGFGHSSSSEEDDGTGERVKKVKAPKVEVDATMSVAKVSGGKEIDVKANVPKGKEVDLKGGTDLKVGGGADLHTKDGIDVGVKGGDAGGKGGFGFGIKVPKFGKGSHSSSSSSEDDGHGHRVKKVKAPKVDAKITVGKVEVKPDVDIKGAKVGVPKATGGVEGSVKGGAELKVGGQVHEKAGGGTDLKVSGDLHVKGGADAGGKGGVGLKKPKFGFGGNSSSSEDDGTGKRVKKVKGPKAEDTGPKVGVEVKIAGHAKAGDVKIGGGDVHAKGGEGAGGKGTFGLKMPKFGLGGDSSSSSEDDGTGKRVKKVKGPNVEGKGPKVGGEVKMGGDVKVGGDLKASADVKLGGDIHTKGGADGGKGGFGFKMPKFGLGGDSSSSSEDDGTGKRVKKVKGPKVDATLSIPKGEVKGNLKTNVGGVKVGGGDLKSSPSADLSIKGPKVEGTL
jgi:hypothetical protein